MLIDRYTLTSFRTASKADREIVATELTSELANMIGDADGRMIDSMKALAALSGDEELFALAMSTRPNVGVFMEALGELMAERLDKIGRK